MKGNCESEIIWKINYFSSKKLIFINCFLKNMVFLHGIANLIENDINLEHKMGKIF